MVRSFRRPSFSTFQQPLPKQPRPGRYWLARTLLTCGVGLAATACTAGDPVPVAVEVLYQNLYCNEEAPGMRTLTAQDLAGAMKSDNALKQTFEQNPQSPPDVRGRHLLLIGLGPKSSGGYNIGLTANTAEIRADTAYIPVRITEPSPGTLQTMQITNPCIVVAIERGAYSTLASEAMPTAAVKVSQP